MVSGWFTTCSRPSIRGNYYHFRTLEGARQHDNLAYTYGKPSGAIGTLITNHGDVRNRVRVAASFRRFSARAQFLKRSGKL